MNSFDYLYRPVSYTPARTRVDVDGKVRLVLAHDDPGYHNWLDTQGFERGNLTYRSLLTQTPTTLSTQLIRYTDLNDALPHDSPRVTKAQRVEQMQLRFASIRRRYGW